MKTLFALFLVTFLLVAHFGSAQTKVAPINTTQLTTDDLREKAPVSDVRTYGAKGDGVLLYATADGGSGCTGTSGSAALTCSAATFTSADVGKVFDLDHAGTANCGQQFFGITGVNINCNLIGTISAVTDATHVTLSTNLLSNVTGEQFTYGTDDRAAVQSALNSGASVIYFPKGIYMVGQNGSALYGVKTPAIFKNKTIRGDGSDVSILFNLGKAYNAAKAYGTLLIDNGSANVLIQDLGFLGGNRSAELTQFGTNTSDGLLVCSGVPSGLGGLCNSSTGIDRLRLVRVAANHHWGIGIHIPGAALPAANGTVTNIDIQDSEASYNSYDGFNPTAYDRIRVDNVTAIGNGTGGIEITSYGTLSVTNSHLNQNKSLGVVAGGSGASTFCTSATIANNEANDNGNGSTVNTVGTGISVTTGCQNVSVVGNTARHNHLDGIALIAITNQDRGWTVAGNTVSTNGILNSSVASGQIYGNLLDGLVTGNNVINENYATLSTIARASNVVTVTTDVPHNFATGYSVTIAGVTGGTTSFNGTFTVTVNDGNHFTFSQTGADESGTVSISGTSTASSTGSGFKPRLGIYFINSRNSKVIFNRVAVNQFDLGDYALTGTNNTFIDWTSGLNINGGNFGGASWPQLIGQSAQFEESGLIQDNNFHRVKCSFDASHNFKCTETKAGTGTNGTFDLNSLGQLDFLSGSGTSVVVEPGGTPKFRFDTDGTFQGFSAGGWNIGGANYPAFISSALYKTATNCANTGGTCSAAPDGAVTIAAGATTVTVATTAVTANSRIFITEDSSLGTALSVTCNTTAGRTYMVTARTAATSFVITSSGAPTTNPACLVYKVEN